MKRIGIYFLFLSLSLIISCTSAKERIIEKPVHVPVTPSILFIGDMMFDWAVYYTIEKYGINYPLQKIKPLFNTFDFVMANLETPLTNSTNCSLSQKYIFKTSSDIAPALFNAGIKAVTLANNHMLDYGSEGLFDTLKTLAAAGILYAGAGKNSITASLPVITRIGSLQVAVLCYTQVCSKDMIAKHTPGVNFFDLLKAKAEIAKYRFCDSVIINIHWGTEYFYYPTSKQVEIAHELIDAGADAIIGHHPHVYQGVEIYRNKPVVYSLGNFLFGSIHEGINDNIACGLFFSENGKLVTLRIYAIKGIFEDGIIQPYVLDAERGLVVFNHIREISKPLGDIFYSRAVIRNQYMEFNFR